MSLRLPPDRTVALVITPRCLLRLPLIDEPDLWFDDGISLHQFFGRRSFLFEDQSLYYYIPRIVTLFFGDRHFTHREQIWQWLEGLSGTTHLRRVALR